MFTHEGGVGVGGVDAKAEKILIPVDLFEYPSNEEIGATLLKKVPRGVHNVLIDFLSRLYAVYGLCQLPSHIFRDQPSRGYPKPRTHFGGCVFP